MKFVLFVLAFFAIAVACITAAPAAGDCTIELGLQCAGAIAQCFQQCKAFTQNPSACFDCLGQNVAPCCPCLRAAFPGLSC